MSEQQPPENGGGKQVSKGRKIFSGIILVGLLVLLGIEGRAGFGHSSTAKALQEIAPEGVFEQQTVTEEQVDAMMSLSPTKEKLEGGNVIVEYKYSWKSVIRPLMNNMPATDLYVTFSDTDPRYAISYGTDEPVLRKQPKLVPGETRSGLQPASLEAPAGLSLEGTEVDPGTAEPSDDEATEPETSGDAPNGDAPSDDA